MIKYLCLILFCMSLTILRAQGYPLPITDYDFRRPENNVSPIAIGMGGLNLTNVGDYFAANSNPALLAHNTSTYVSTSFRLGNEEDLSFLEAMSLGNVLKARQFGYFTLVSKSVGWSYQPLAALHISQWNAAGDESQYYDFKLDAFQMTIGAKDNRYEHIAAGLTLKYVTGRLVYLRESFHNNQFIREAFIDNKVKGFSSDLGFVVRQGNFTWAGSVYDVFSRLYWESYESEEIQRRAALGFEYQSGGLSLLGGVQGKVSRTPDTTFHLGLIQDWEWESQDFATDDIVTQNFILRLGLYSDDFHGTDNINYTLGTGYNYNMFRIDFSLTNSGMRLRDSEYLFSLALSM